MKIWPNSRGWTRNRRILPNWPRTNCYMFGYFICNKCFVNLNMAGHPWWNIKFHKRNEWRRSFISTISCFIQKREQIHESLLHFSGKKNMKASYSTVLARYFVVLAWYPTYFAWYSGFLSRFRVILPTFL